MSLLDGTSKMSKSAENDGSRINLLDSPDVIRKKIQRCKTDTAIGRWVGGLGGCMLWLISAFNHPPIHPKTQA